MKLIIADQNTKTQSIGVYEDSHTVQPNETDISSIINWDLYAPRVVGSFTNMRDEKCIQREIKAIAGDIPANWGTFSSDEKEVLIKWCTSSVAPLDFGTMYPDADDRKLISMAFDSRNTEARVKRYQAVRMYLFGKLGTASGLATLIAATKESLIELYEGGVEGTVEDGVEGLLDFIEGRAGTSYASGQTVEGLPHRGYSVVDGSGDTLQDVADAASAILLNGLY